MVKLGWYICIARYHFMNLKKEDIGPNPQAKKKRYNQDGKKYDTLAKAKQNERSKKRRIQDPLHRSCRSLCLCSTGMNFFRK
jgi:hypothetical protein